MCGLVGAAGNLVDADRKALKLLMVFDTVRGEHSTGMAFINKQNKGAAIAKEIGDPFRLFQSFDCFDDYGLIKDVNKYKALIGHNRYATKGAVTAENAHPFHHGNIIGAHNGTLKSVKHLEDGDKFAVDSEAIFYNLSKYSPEEVVPKIDGAYALTWYNTDEERMYFIRNVERPLFGTRRTDNDVIFWASEEWMLELALERAGVKHQGIQRFLSDTLYSFDLKDTSYAAMRTKKMEDHGKIEGYKAPVVVRPVGKGSGVDRNGPFQGFPSYNDWWADQCAKKAKQNGSNATNVGKLIGGSIPVDQLRKFIGEEITFTIDDDCMGLNGVHYVFGNPTDGRDFEIRIFGSHLPVWNDLVYLSTVWKAKIKGAVELHQANGSIERYVTLDNRSIVEAPIEKKEEKKEDENTDNIVPFVQSSTKFYEGWNGMPLTKEQWIESTKCGCQWCGIPLYLADAPRTIFADVDSPICEFCQCLDDVQLYLQMTGVQRSAILN